MVLISYVTAKGQVDIPANPDYTAAAIPVVSTSIQNTGNDIKPRSSSFWHVNTWDGSKPSWSWAINNVVQKTYDIQGINTGIVSDPDIVLSMDREWVRIVYVLDGFLVTSELWQFNGTDYSYVSTQTLDEGINPNIDVNNANHVAVTYQKLGVPQVFAFVEEINNTLAGPIFINQDGQRPDVAISNFAGILGQVVVSFTYISPDDQVLVLDQHRYGNLLSGSSTAISQEFRPIDAWQAINGTFGTPRIAHNWYNETFPWCQFTVDDWHLSCAVAVDFKATNNDEYIYTMTRHINGCNMPGTTFQLSVVNTANNSFVAPQENRRPVVSYCGDVIVVAWEYLRPLPPATVVLSNTINRDIIVRRLTWNGIPWGINVYSRVNLLNTGDQVIPSVSGRYTTGGATASDCYYLFVDQNANDVLFKGSYYHNINLRPVTSGSMEYKKQVLTDDQEQVQLFPNPASDLLTIQGVSHGASIEILDRLGRQMLFMQSNSTQEQIRLPENMPSGNYAVRLVDEKQGVKHLPFIRQ